LLGLIATICKYLSGYGVVVIYYRQRRYWVIEFVQFYGNNVFRAFLYCLYQPFLVVDWYAIETGPEHRIKTVFLCWYTNFHLLVGHSCYVDRHNWYRQNFWRRWQGLPGWPVIFYLFVICVCSSCNRTWTCSVNIFRTV
jgi:hypothetical protein